MASKAELTPENYLKGCLVDEECMAAVSADPERPGHFMAMVLRHSTGEYLGAESFEKLDAALEAINRIPRNWNFEKTGGCSEDCGNGQCSIGGCGKEKCEEEKCELYLP